MAQQTPVPSSIATNENDLKNNRLGLMSQRQTEQIQKHIDYYQARISEIVQRTIIISVFTTLGIVILAFIGILPIPLAIIIEIVVVGGMVYMSTDFNRFMQQLLMDKEAGAVRIIKGRTSRYTLRNHPLYQTLRVEVQTYKVLDPALLREFKTGELYQVYVLPQSRVIIAAEKLGETSGGYLH